MHFRVDRIFKILLLILAQSSIINSGVFINQSNINNDIGVKFNYLAQRKSVEKTIRNTYKVQNQSINLNDIEEIKPGQHFILIPDEAWGAGESFDTNPNSTLQELFNDGIKSKELYERAVVRPFVSKKQITTQDLKEAKIKYLDFTNRELKVFTKGNIEDLFLSRQFKDKNPNWDEITFNKLAQMKKGDLIIDNDFQVQWFEKFIKNPNLANKTFKDFWPKYDEGRFFVIASYKPSIELTQIELSEKAGFWPAGTLRDENNLVTNINYVIELEVKNKIYNSRVQEFNINDQNYNNPIFSYSKYKTIMNQLTLDAIKSFAIDSARFVPGQIQQPKINFEESLNNFVASGFGKITIDYQKTLPIAIQVGNEILEEQLPFDLNNVTGMNQFKSQYSKYIVENIDQYNKLNELQKESKILLDNTNNKIIIGGKVIAELQNFNINVLNQQAAIIIEDEYLDPKVAIYGFDQKTKKYTSLEELQKEWSSYTQLELFDKLFGNYNHSNKKEILKKVIQDYDVKFKVVITETQFKVIYDYKPDPQSNNRITDDQTLSPLNLVNIRPVKLNNLNKSSFAYGYDQQQDYNVPFNVLIENLKNKEILASHFNFKNDFERNNFIDGIKTIEILENPTKNSIKIKITLNENFITYNENDSLIIDASAKEFEKFDLGNLELGNINLEIKNKLAFLSDEEVIKYLNNLDLATKKSFFISQTKEIKELTQTDKTKQPEENLKDIDFYFDGDKLVANVKLNKDWLLLAKNNKTSIDNFMYNLKIDLGIINPFKEKWMPVIIGIVTTVLSVGIAFLTWQIIKKNKRNQELIEKIQTDKNKVDPPNFENNNTDL